MGGYVAAVPSIFGDRTRIVVREHGALDQKAYDLIDAWIAAHVDPQRRWSGVPAIVWRGMEKAEYDATVGAGKPVHSTGAYSHHSEGTNFSADPGDAESYVNYGRSDPRVTGDATYLVGVRSTPDMERWRDGYVKTKKPVPLSRLVEVWEMRPENGKIVGRKLPTTRRNTPRLGAVLMARRGYIFRVGRMPARDRGGSEGFEFFSDHPAFTQGTRPVRIGWIRFPDEADRDEVDAIIAELGVTFEAAGDGTQLVSRMQQVLRRGVAQLSDAAGEAYGTTPARKNRKRKKTKRPAPPKGRDWLVVHAKGLSGRKGAGAHKDRSRYSRKKKHKGRSRNPQGSVRLTGEEKKQLSTLLQHSDPATQKMGMEMIRSINPHPDDFIDVALFSQIFVALYRTRALGGKARIAKELAPGVIRELRAQGKEPSGWERGKPSGWLRAKKRARDIETAMAAWPSPRIATMTANLVRESFPDWLTPEGINLYGTLTYERGRQIIKDYLRKKDVQLVFNS